MRGASRHNIMHAIYISYFTCKNIRPRFKKRSRKQEKKITQKSGNFKNQNK